MKRTEILPNIEKAIATRKASGSGKWDITWIENAFICQPTTKIPAPEISFATVSQCQCTEGFTSKQWDEMLSEILAFFEQKGLL